MSPTSWRSHPHRERAILAGRETRGRHGENGRLLTELRLLAETAGAQVRGEVLQRRGPIRSSTFLSKGKIEEVRVLSGEEQATLLLLDDDLSPAQSRNLGEQLNMKVVDRTGLILDIFSRRARTREARIQVELAQLEYLLPRLTRMWEHLSRLGGGIGTRGPGETQLEVDRRRVRERIAKLKRELERVVKERRVQRRGRRGCFKVSLVGYTNAGKSTLFNALTRASVYVEDQLFATLDPTTRVFPIGRNTRALLTDTVGFIRKLPSHLVVSFRATLEEVTEADLLLHVVDATEPDIDAHIQAVEAVLDSIGALGRPRLCVFNKIDAVPDEVSVLGLRAGYPGAVFVSALTRDGIPELREAAMRHVIENAGHEERAARGGSTGS
ncbi:MAG: GTPase HflX [Candidatus Eisenbacteria bacterium]|uniref:GTPase HflX n=1 Tax=Eiseniibacteriota bacterium TaxID=2212470 RepID=A0A538T487_UNCEI|nr:MAG: GTPase HflX [Candidatus Eisenbacteria bacterium]